MTVDQMDTVVEVYLQRLKSALASLPPATAEQLFDDIAAHISEARRELHPENEAALRELLDQVGDPEVIAASAGTASSGPTVHRRTRQLLVAGGMGVLLCVSAFALGFFLTRGPSHAKPLKATSSVLSHLPTTTRPILLEHENAGDISWTFWAKAGSARNAMRRVRVGNVVLTFSSHGGVCTALALEPPGGIGVGGGSGPCIGSPREPTNFTLSGFGPGTGWNARVTMGVTSVPAKSFRIRLVAVTTPLIVDALNSSALPGLRFFAVSLPVSERTASIEALDANGRVLVTAKKESLPQPP